MGLQLSDEQAQEVLSIGEYFIRCYVASREGLKRLGILRSDRTLQGDYAEWVAAQVLGLRLEPSGVAKATDAWDDEGYSYQIKSRIVRSLFQSTSFDFRNIEHHFDFLIAVFLSPSFEVLAMLKVPYGVVRELGSQTKSTFRFRWNQSMAQNLDPRIEPVIWPDELA